MRAILLTFCLLLAGCGTLEGWVVEKAESAATRWAEGKVEALVGEQFAEWKKAADADQSGETSAQEWLDWLRSGGIGVIALAMAEYARRRLKKKTGELYGEIAKATAAE